MVKEHVDLLQRYWELLTETGMEADYEDFFDEQSLLKAIHVMETKKTSDKK